MTDGKIHIGKGFTDNVYAGRIRVNKMTKRIRYTTEELKIMSVALWQLEEALDISKEHWEDNNDLKKKNEKDLKTIKSARRKVNEALKKKEDVKC